MTSYVALLYSIILGPGTNVLEAAARVLDRIEGRLSNR